MFHNSSITNSTTVGSTWTRSDNKLFELALVQVPEEETVDRWERIAAIVPGKSPQEIKEHYCALVYDVIAIDSGMVELPRYNRDRSEAEPPVMRELFEGEGEVAEWYGSKIKRGEVVERKKGTPWTENEHRLFLEGLKKYGKGDWRSISRLVVKTRTSTQVASHAQKYFLRRSSLKKDRKRSSIHDITTTANPVPLPTHFPTQGGNSPDNQNWGFPT
ncbi:hypothetical protein LguiA_016668 [Lonicera macranthoides]